VLLVTFCRLAGRFDALPRCRTSGCSGSCRTQELEWGAEGYQQVVASLASSPLDLVLAADCCYVDQVSALGPRQVLAHGPKIRGQPVALRLRVADWRRGCLECSAS
jgi:hypothetical protein